MNKQNDIANKVKCQKCWGTGVESYNYQCTMCNGIGSISQTPPTEEKQKPVAYMTPTKALYLVEDVDGCIDPRHTPLYTHPQKELTDEEIIDTMKETFGSLFLYEFGNKLWEYTGNLLKKAREK